ncbi:MAG: GNAT family N-acetyltransferase [Candidatus Lindowbacteria bacterium]|nr:GNAT family N-acetyltransferase [Candidatus Lindowbacteria bacterium]
MTERISIVTSREAEKRDLAAIIELMKGLTIKTSAAEAQGASTLAEYESIFEQISRDPNHKLYVVETGGRVVGAADLLIVPNLSHRGLPWAIIENVVVDENARRKGIGRELVKHLVKVAKESGCYKIGLTSDRKRTAAHRLYESLGFDQYGLAFRIYF